MKTPEIESIIEHFNFEAVRALMIVNKWTYAGERQPPTIDEMKALVYSLYRSLIDCDRPNNRCGTGGFKLCRWEWETSIELELIFAWQVMGETIGREVTP